MYNETNSIKDLTKAYESLKTVVMKEASWDAMKKKCPRSNSKPIRPA